MFSIFQRTQTVANHVVTLTMVLSVAIMASFFVQLSFNNSYSLSSTIADISAATTVKHSYNYGSTNRKPKENTKVTFDLAADLTPLFTWNTKQVFVYVTAEYPGKSAGSSNKVTYWDQIITSKEDAVLNLTKQKSKYSVWDVEPTFRDREAILRLEWNIQPWVGPLVFGQTLGDGNFVYSRD